MSSAAFEFPVEQFLQCIRNNRANSNRFIGQAKNLNIYWIYQMIKHSHNSILETKQLPATKLNALLIIKDLMETCQIPCINLIEVYMLPIAYEIAIEKPHEKGERRGSTFFQQNAKNVKIPNIEETGIKFMTLCTQLLAAGSYIKPKRIFQNQELKQKSEFVDYYDKYLKYGISGPSLQIANLNNFSSGFKEKGRDNFLKNLNKFNQKCGQYGQYFVTKMMQSVESDSNPLFNLGAQSISSISNELDMRKLLKHGDPSITSPLIDELILKMKILPNFMAKKNCLSLLTDFIKWGDAEAFVRLCYEGSLQKIGFRIAQVNGNKGMTQGENIYPQVKGQRDGKRKFYTQYLKSIEVITKCLQNQKLQIEEAHKIPELYDYFKKEKKFQFPQNLMMKRIENDFKQNLQYNEEKNILIMKLLRQQNKSPRKGQEKIGKQQSNLQQINNNLEECVQQIFKVTSNEKQIDKRMTNVVKLKTKFEEQMLGLLDQNQNQELPEDEVEYVLQNGQEIIKIVQKLQALLSQYKNKTINFNEFQVKYAELTKSLQFQQSEAPPSILNQNNRKQKIQNLKNSSEQVVSSFKMTKGKNGSSINNQTNGSNIGIKIMEKSNNILLKSVQNGSLNTNQIAGKTTQGFQSQKQSTFEVEKRSANSVIQPQQSKQSQQEILNQVTSSILSEKRKIIRVSKKGESKISSHQNASNSIISKGSKLKEKIARKKQKLSQLKLPGKSEYGQSKIESQSISYQNPQHSAAFKTENSQQSNMKSDAYSKESNVEYVEYESPESLNILKRNGTAPHFHKKSQNQNENRNSDNIYITTAPAEIIGKNGELSGQKSEGLKIQPKQLKNNLNSEEEYGIVTYKQQIQHENSSQSSKFKNGNLPQKKGIQLTNQLKNSEKMNGAQPFIGPNGFRGQSQKGQSELHTQQYKKQENKLYNMYKTQKMSSSGKDHQSKIKVSQISSVNGSVKMENFDRMQKSEKDDKYERDSDSYKSCNKEAANNFKDYMKKQPDNIYLKRKNEDSRSSQQYYSIKNESFSDSLQIKQPINYRNAAYFDQEDMIKQPQLKPLNESYYHPIDIQREVKQSLKPQFRNCFQIEKQLIRSPRQKVNAYLVVQQRSKMITQQARNLVLKPHEQYLVSKIRKQYEKQTDAETKQLGSRVLELKMNNSRLRNQIKHKQEQVSKFSRFRQSQRQYSDCVSFSRSKEHSNSSSPYKFQTNQNESIEKSRVFLYTAQGQIINEALYARLLSELREDKLKKACLKNKCLLFRNDVWEIGTMLKQTLSSTALTLFLTPSCKVTNFTYSVTKQPNLQIECISKGYSEIVQNRQIKIELDCKIKNFNYNLPIINISYSKGAEPKNISFYLPLTFNKFVSFSEGDVLKIDANLTKSQKLRRTIQFEANKKVIKVDNVNEYLPSVGLISEDLTRKLKIYAASAKYRNETFQLIITSTGGQKMIIQALMQNEREYQGADYLLYSLKKIMST